MEHLPYYLAGLCNVIEYNHPLVRDLEFIKCNINDHSAFYLAERVVFEPTFRDLIRISFNHNKITDETIGKFKTLMDKLTKPTNRLSIIELAGNSISSYSFSMIFSILRNRFLHIKILNLASNKLGDESLEVLMSGISQNEYLQVLDLSDNNLTDTGLQSVMENL